MKRVIFFAAVFFGLLSFKQVNAQVSFDLNIKNQPLWGPVGYDHADYYYLPDIECYYEVNSHQFIYQDGNKWQRSATLPPKYKSYDLYKGYKVVINQPQPFLDHDRYRKSYLKYKGKKSTPIIRDSHDHKYKGAGQPAPQNHPPVRH